MLLQDELGGAILPPVVPLSSENLEHDGIFLLETGEDAFLYVGKQASPEVLYKLFGVRSVDEVVTGQVHIMTNPVLFIPCKFFLTFTPQICTEGSCKDQYSLFFLVTVWEVRCLKQSSTYSSSFTPHIQGLMRLLFCGCSFICKSMTMRCQKDLMK